MAEIASLAVTVSGQSLTGIHSLVNGYKTGRTVVMACEDLSREARSIIDSLEKKSRRYILGQNNFENLRNSRDACIKHHDKLKELLFVEKQKMIAQGKVVALLTFLWTRKEALDLEISLLGRAVAAYQCLTTSILEDEEIPQIDSQPRFEGYLGPLPSVAEAQRPEWEGGIATDLERFESSAGN